MINTTATFERHNTSSFDAFLVFVLLCISGNPLVGDISEFLYIIMALVLLFLSLSKKTAVYSKQMRLVSFFLILLFCLQYVFVRNVSIPADINHFSKIYCGFLVASLVGVRFRAAYFRVMTIICAISMVGYILNILIGNFPGVSINQQVSVFIYNYIPDYYADQGLRNSGMFWEPGAFQGYIMLAFIMYLDDFRALYKNYKLNVVIMIIALLTTKSTTGYVVFAMFLFLVFAKDIKKSPMTIVIMGMLMAVAIWAFNSFDFLGDKMLGQYEGAKELGEGDVSSTRMGSAVIAWQNLLRHPLIGNGFNTTALYGDLADYMESMGNGFFGAMNQLGIPFILYYLFLIYRNCPIPRKFYRWGYVLLLVLLINGEFFLNYPLFWALLFVKFPTLDQQAEKRIVRANYYLQTS